MQTVKKNTVLKNLEIVDISSEGKAVAKQDNLVIFIKGAVPGDIVDAQITRKKSSFAEAKAINLLKSSEYRVSPVCEHFGTCGGCKWQDLSYERQLYFKEKLVREALQRIGKVEVGTFFPILGNKSPFQYRNKLEFAFSNKRWLTDAELNSTQALNKNGLGFHIPGLFDKVLDIKTCHLQDNINNEIRNAVREYAIKNQLSFFDIRDKQGMLRTLLIRTTSTGEVMIVISMFENREEEMRLLCQYLVERFPNITSLQYVHNPKGNDTIQDLDLILFHGSPFITEEMEGLKFRISAKSFYQTNSDQAYELYKITREYADLQRADIVYDLYTGTGTIANFVARKCAKVVGIEYVEPAIVDAKINSEINGISNTVFYSGDMKKVFTADFVSKNGTPDVIITDPPRAGMDPEVIEVIKQLKPRKIVYVSCNPSTQARDLALLKDMYIVGRVQPVDMFPQTSHVENVAELILK